MNERFLSNPNQAATLQQIQAVLDKVRLIANPLELIHTDLTDEPCPPHQEFIKGNLMLFHYPEGEILQDEPEHINLATISLRQLDSSEEQYDLLMSENGLRLRKRLWSSPYWKREEETESTPISDPVTAGIARQLLSLEKDQAAWAMEREFALDGATAADADKLLAALDSAL